MATGVIISKRLCRLIVLAIAVGVIQRSFAGCEVSALGKVVDSGTLTLKTSFIRGWRLCWQEVQTSQRSTKFQLLATRLDGTVAVVDSPSTVVRLFVSNPRLMTDEEALTAAMMADAITDLGRALSWGGYLHASEYRGVSSRLEPGCKVISGLRDLDVASVDDVANRKLGELTPVVGRSSNMTRVSYLCEYEDLGDSIWRVFVEISDDRSASVNRVSTGLRIRDRRLEVDSRIYEVR